LLWAVIHFLLIGGFFVSFVLLIGAAIHINLVRTFIIERELRMVPLQALMYGFAGTIVFYTAAISCLIEGGDPRYRVPADALIVFMLFLGSQSWWRLVSFLRIAADKVKGSPGLRKGNPVTRVAGLGKLIARWKLI
jgi:hypothetical protein